MRESSPGNPIDMTELFSDPLRTLGIDEEQYEILQLAALEKHLEVLETLSDPMQYGLPDLLYTPRDGEELGAYRHRQNADLKQFIEGRLWFVKDDRVRRIKCNHQMLDAIADIFYRRVRKAIWWKPRGGGGSLGAAILIFLMMVYWRTSIMDMAGSGSQAKNIYDYSKQFWSCFPALRTALVDGEPLLSQLVLKNGVALFCVSSSEKSSRGKHPPALVCDEACQRDRSSDNSFSAAIQTVLSEPDPLILLLSTFHHPIGVFQEHWDYAEEKGFARYKWDIYDTMAKCVLPILCETCPLTREEIEVDAFGNARKVLAGCNGKARNSDGFMTFDQVMEAKKTNKGTQVYEIEFECRRPDWKGHVFPPELIEASLVEEVSVERKGARLVVGLDWGFIGQTAMVLVVKGVPPHGKAFVLEGTFMTGKLTTEVIKVLEEWRLKYGEFEVYADASHSFNNFEVQEAGFVISAVPFKKYKALMYGNVMKYLVEGDLKVLVDVAILIGQLRELKTDKVGQIVKKNDHGPDALGCAMLAFPYLEEFPEVPGDREQAYDGLPRSARPIYESDDDGQSKSTSDDVRVF